MEEDGRLLRVMMILLVIVTLLFTYRWSTTSSQWIGQKEINGESVIVTKWKENPPRGWRIVRAKTELIKIIRLIKPDELARFDDTFGTYFAKLPNGSIAEVEAKEGDRNIFRVWVKENDRIPDFFTNY